MFAMLCMMGLTVYNHWPNDKLQEHSLFKQSKTPEGLVSDVRFLTSNGGLILSLTNKTLRKSLYTPSTR